MVTADYEMKQGDQTPILRTTLTERGYAKDLSVADHVEFSMVSYETGTTVIDSVEASIINADEGKVAYHWKTGETDERGLFFAEWVVVYPDGTEQTFSNEEYDIIHIFDSL